MSRVVIKVRTVRMDKWDGEMGWKILFEWIVGISTRGLNLTKDAWASTASPP